MEGVNFSSLPCNEKVLESIRGEIVDGADDAFVIVDLDEVEHQVNVWKKLLPRVEPFYAVKCNDDKRIIERMVKLGLSFDCASRAEIDLVLRQGAETDQVIFANPCKPMSHIAYARDENIRMMTFDNEDELLKIHSVYPDVQLLLRLLPDETHSRCKLGVKFGADIEMVPSLLQTAKELNMNVIGVSYHVGSGCKSTRAFSDAVRLARRAFDMAASMDVEFTMLDIGGGFTAGMFHEICAEMGPTLEELFPPECGVRIIGEPGRYMVENCGTLVTQVIGRRRTCLDDDEIVSKDSFEEEESNKAPPRLVVRYYINDGVYGSFNNLIYDHATCQPYPFRPDETAGSSVVSGSSEEDPIRNCSSVELYESSLWGPTCDGLDCVTKKIHLPLLDIGEWIIFPKMGAYTVSAAAAFNGFPLAIRKYV